MEKKQGPKLRVEKLNSLIQELLGPILPRYTDGIAALTTVTQVAVSGDLKHAKVWISVLGKAPAEKVLALLEKNIYDIQGDLNQSLPMKVIPRLKFVIDTAPEYAQHISEVIDKIQKDEEK